jgi:hypothetical protein
MTRALDEGLLERLLSAWREQGAPIADRLVPGLSDQEMDDLMAPTGLRLPAEARCWWGWHDGITNYVSRAKEMGPDIDIQPLAEAIEFVAEFPLGGGDEEAPATWFPFAGVPRGVLTLDCAADDLAPTHRVDFEVGLGPGTASMGEMVLLWIQMMESGAWTWNTAEARWIRHYDSWPDFAKGVYVI